MTDGPTPRYMAPIPERPVTEPSEHPTAPYGQPTPAQFRALVDEEVRERVEKIEQVRRMDLVFATVRLMEPDERARILKQLLDVFGEEAGL